TRQGIEIDVSGQLGALFANHRGSRRQRNGRELGEWDLGAQRRFHQDAIQIRKVLSEAALVPDIDRIALASLDGPRDILSPDRRLDDVLDVADRQPMTSNGLAVGLNVREVALRDALGVDTPRAGNRRQRPLDLLAQSLTPVQILPDNLDAD